MNIIEAINKRKSSRTYKQVALAPADKKNLENFIVENSKGLENEAVNFKIIEKKIADNQMKLDLGIIKGHNTYILGIAKSTLASRVNYGYLMEKIVLKTTEMNMSTCWVGYFDYNYFNEISIEDGFDIPSLVIVGYSEERQHYKRNL
jgi:nitroreductase